MPRKKQKSSDTKEYEFVYVEDFIRRLRHQEWLIDPAGRTIQVKVTHDGPILPLSSHLRMAIRDYED